MSPAVNSPYPRRKKLLILRILGELVGVVQPARSVLAVFKDECLSVFVN